MNLVLEKIKSIFKKKIFLFFLVSAVIYKSIFNGYSTEFLIKKIFSKLSTGSIELSVTKSSLFFGFNFEKMEIRSDSEFNREILFATDKLSLNYNLPYLFLGKLQIDEISLINPKINLFQKNKVWNFEKLMKPSEEVPEKKKEEESEPLNEISTYIPVAAYTKILIQNLTFKMEAETGKDFFKAYLQKFDFRFLLKTKRVNKIPLNLNIVSIFDELKIELNPDREIYLDVQDNLAKLDTNLKMFLNLYFKSEAGKPIFYSNLDIGSDKIPIKMKKGFVQPFQFQILYNLVYNPLDDTANLSKFLFSFANNKFIEAKGEVKKMSSDNPEVDFEITESKIDLDIIERITDTVPIIPPMNMSGIFSLKPFFVKGKLDDLFVSSGINAKKIQIQFAGLNHNIPIMKMDFDSRLDLKTKEVSSENNLLPILKEVNIRNILGEYNGILLQIKGEKFVPDLLGDAKLKIHVLGKKLSYLKIDIQSLISGVRYKLGRGISGMNHIALDFKAILDLKKDFQLEELVTQEISLVLKNDTYQKALELKSDLTVKMKKQLEVNLSPIRLQSNFTNLIPTIPVSLRNTIAGLRTSLGNEINLDGKFSLLDDKKNKTIDLSLLTALPALELKDLLTQVKIQIGSDEEETIQVEKISLTAFENKLKGNFSGKFYKPKKPNLPFGEYTGELDGNLTIESEKPRYVFKGMTFQGDIDLDVHLKDRYAKGYLRSKDSNIVYKSPSCPKDCKVYEVNGIKLNIPFLHDLLDKTTEDLVSGNKRNFIKTYGQDEAPNFIINDIKGTHPRFENAMLDIVKSDSKGAGLTARIDYIENFLTVDLLKIKSLNGLIYGKDILLNIGSGNPELIEYEGVVQVRDIDLRELLSEESRKKIDDGKLKMDLNFSGRNLNDTLSELKLFFSTYYIGEDFGKSAIRIVNADNLVTDMVMSRYKVDRIEVELNKGLVYAVIKFKKQFVGLFKLDNDAISQERIPLANFLKRTESEINKKY
jgi:hypothetical protein